MRGLTARLNCATVRWSTPPRVRNKVKGSKKPHFFDMNYLLIPYCHTQKLKLGTIVPWAVTHNSIVQNFDICLCSRNMRLTLPQIRKTVEFGVNSIFGARYLKNTRSDFGPVFFFLFVSSSSDQICENWKIDFYGPSGLKTQQAFCFALSHMDRMCVDQLRS